MKKLQKWNIIHLNRETFKNIKMDNMMRTFTIILATCMIGTLGAQTALDPGQFVNGQITGPGVYTVEPGQFYAFDGRIDLTFEITIEGPDEGWIMETASPAVLVNTPAADGAARQFFELEEGGALTLKNVIISGINSNGEVGGTFVNNTGGSKLIVDNCVITDWQDFALRNQVKGDSVSVTNTVYINGTRLRYSQWGGFPIRLDVAPDNMVFENNTVINSGRLLANSGPFHNSNIQQMHNTYVNHAVAGEEQRANEFLITNNIYYNYHFIGYLTANHSSPDNTYGSYFTTWNYFADSKEKLDSIGLYMGSNLFYTEPLISDWFETVGADSVAPGLLWEHPDVDSFITTDDNYTIGANYAEIEPEFTTPPGNTQEIVNFINELRTNPSAEWVDYRIESPVTFADDGTPSLSWPPAFDMSYSNSFLQTAGTDGLPLGDLNWFPDQKAEYLANRESFIEALRDSMVNAQVFYDPETMDQTPLITEATTSSRDVITGQLYLTNYPNPFTQTTKIEFGLDKSSKVTLRIMNLLGQQVFELSDMQLPSGNHAYDFHANNLNSGIYLIRLDAEDISGQNYSDAKSIILTN